MLTAEQRNIIENSIWVVNAALKKQGLQQDEDLRQSAILYMCQCLERFDPSKNIKWSTFAYKNVYLFLKRTQKKKVEDAFYRINYSDLNLKQILYFRYKACPTSKRTSPYSLVDVKKICSDEEKKILELKLRGYKAVEIGKILKCSQFRVRDCVSSIKTKAREVFTEK